MLTVLMESLSNSKYKQHVIYAIIVGGYLASALIILVTLQLVFEATIPPSLFVVALVSGLACMATFMSTLEPQHVRKMVKDKLLAPVKQLHTSIMELQECQYLIGGSPDILIGQFQVNNAECREVIKRLILDNELIMKRLKRIDEKICWHNQFVELGRSLGYAMQISGFGVVMAQIIDMLKCGIGDFSWFVLVGISLMALGMIFVKVLNTEMHSKTKKIVENGVVPLIVKLQESVDELQMQCTDVARMCANQMTQLKYFCSLDTSQTTIISFTNILHLIRWFLHDKTYPTTEQIFDHMLPWLEQHIKELKNAEQQLTACAEITANDA